MKRPKKLSASFVKTVNRPGRYGDGRGGFGLSLLVKPTTTGRLSKTWSQRLRIHANPVNVGLGAYPIVTLAEARKAALENRRTVARGRDPRSGGVPTFAQAAETVISMHRPSWRSGGRHEAQWRGSLRNHALPRLGHKPVSAITTADVMGVLLADDFWNRKRVTAQRVRHRVRHQRALPHGEVAAELRRVDASNALPSTKLALKLLTLTASRSGEVRKARWSEFDLKATIWTILEDRTKSGRDHRVPLSFGALKVLDQAKALGQLLTS